MSNYGYRDYAPWQGRFTTVDPIRDGFNWYAYCENNPVNLVDLWGLNAGDGDNATIDGSSVEGKMSQDGIDVLKLLEVPPFKNGKTGLHRPGDKTVTYGYGEIVKRGNKAYPKINNALKKKYPDMTEVEATARLKGILSKKKPRRKYEPVVNQYIKNRGLQVNQNQFDALVSVQYNSGTVGFLLDEITAVNAKYDKEGKVWKVFFDDRKNRIYADIIDIDNIYTDIERKRRNSITRVFVNYRSKKYKGLRQRRYTEAQMYFGEYDKGFKYDKNFKYDETKYDY